MNCKHTIRGVLLVGMLTAGLAGAGFAQDQNPTPQPMPAPEPMHEGNVTYITGGIGSDEEEAIRSEAKDYDLRISSAGKDGNFVGNTDFVIKSKNGHEMIHVENAGPLFYAKLPEGEYVVQATSGMEHMTREIKISRRQPTNLHLIWQS